MALWRWRSSMTASRSAVLEGSPQGLPSMICRGNTIQRNPLIADVFYRAGLIEKWGRGTDRVVVQCAETGIAPPEFREIAGSTAVTFRAQVGFTPQVVALLEAALQPRSPEELQQVAGLRDRMLHNRQRPVLINPSPPMATETGPRSGNETRGAVLRSPDPPLPSESSCVLARHKS